jgi:MFS family permease
MTTLGKHLCEIRVALGGVFGNRNLRRLQLALVLSEASAPAYAAALFVYAFRQGGAAEAGLVGLATMLPAALIAPFSAALADRLPRDRVLFGAALVRGLLLSAAALALVLQLPSATVYVLAAAASIASRLYFPARAALLPDIVASDAELVAANSVGSVIESLGSVAGPALAGGLLAVASPALVFAIAGVAAFAAAAATARIHPVRAAEPSQRWGGAELFEGFRLIATDPRLRLIVGIFTVQVLTFGALGVIVVALALDELDLGASGVGLLNGAMGLGGVVGGIAAIRVVPLLHAGVAMRLGGLLWGLPIAAAGLAPGTAAVAFLLGLAAAGCVLLDVPGYSMLQSCTPANAIGRVFGVLEGVLVGAVSLGSLLGGLLVATCGARPALLVVGSVVPVAVILAWRAFDRLDELDRLDETMPILSVVREAA